MTTQKMQIIKRNGTKENIQLDKISLRIQNLTKGLDTDYVDWYRPAKKVLDGLYDGVTSVELDTLAAETAAALTSQHPDYAILAGRLAITAHYKETEFSFSNTVERLHKHIHPKTGESAGLIADDIYEIIMKNRKVLDAAIDESEDMNYSFFGFKTLYNAYLTKINGKPVERIQHMMMRVSVGIWRDNIKEVLTTYKLMSSRMMTHATPTLFNSGTRLNQLASCFLLPSVDDSIIGMYKAAMDMAVISKLSGGIGIPVSDIRATGAYIRGTNGESNGIIPLMKVYNELGKHVNQCFAPQTRVHTAEGSKMISEVTTNDLVLGHSGRYCQVTEVMSYDQEGDMVSLDLVKSMEPLEVTTGHPFWAIRDKSVEGVSVPEWVEAGELTTASLVGQKVPTEVIKADGFTVDDITMYAMLLMNGSMTKDGQFFELEVTEDNGFEEFAYLYLSGRNTFFWLTKENGVSKIHWGADDMVITYDHLYSNTGEIRIHRQFTHLNDECTWAIIKTMLRAKTNFTKRGVIVFTSKSISLVNGLRYQLLRMGVPTKGLTTTFHGDNTNSSDIFTSVHVPAVKELAETFKIEEITDRDWVIIDGHIFSGIKSVTPITKSTKVYDLKVEFDETYHVADALVHNGGKRKGSIAVYLEPWHADVFDFLELKKNHGAEDLRARDLFPALWVSDLFMERVREEGQWTLFCPDEAPGLTKVFDDRLTGEKNFTKLYTQYEAEGRGRKTIKAMDLWVHMLECASETGVPYMLFKDAANSKSNQKNVGVIKSSNLCCEILEVTFPDEIAVCNLASIALPRFLKQIDNQHIFDYKELYRVAYQTTKNLNQVIDVNLYALPETKKSNMRHRPISIGVQGFADLIAIMGYEYESQQSQELNKEIFETIYFATVTASKDLAMKNGHYETFPGSPMSKGIFQFDMWTENKVQAKLGVLSVVEANPITLSGRWDWEKLRGEVVKYGVRNSLLVGPMPTASTASILDNNESFEAFTSNIYRRQTLGGEFMMVNKHLVRDLVKIGEWNTELKNEIIVNNGSVQGIKRIPEYLQARYKTQWEIKQRTIIDMAAARGAFVCQSQSMNLFIPNNDKFMATLSATWQYGFLKGLKTGSYYIRTKGATKGNAALGVSTETPEMLAKEAEARQCAIDARESGGDCLACGS